MSVKILFISSPSDADDVLPEKSSGASSPSDADDVLPEKSSGASSPSDADDVLPEKSSGASSPPPLVSVECSLVTFQRHVQYQI